jgi:hypothetical protein
MRIDGGCHCGFIKYEGDADPEKTAICHCTDCQTLSGSAFRTVVPCEDLRFVSGQPTIYLKTGDSGNQRQQAFCPKCGSPIFSAAPGSGSKVHMIRIGTLRQRNQFVPKVQLWARSKQRWTDTLPSVKSIEKER